MNDLPHNHIEDRPHRHRISVQDYHRMADLGLLAGNVRVELIEGAIFDKAPAGARHRALAGRLEALLRQAVGAQGVVHRHAALRLGSDSEPVPDLAVLRARPGGYGRSGPPTASDTLLVIEISEATWHYDHDTKVPFYARRGVPEVWLFDLTSATVHFFRALMDGSYADQTATENPGLTFLPGLTDAAADLAEVFSRP